jgi:hypothetical protein
MDIIYIPASITMENSISTQRYKWKSDSSKESIYKRKSRRAVVRFTSKKLADKMSKIKRSNRQILIEFSDKNNLKIKRINKKGISLQAYSGNHPYIQIIINKALPKELWEKFENSNKKTITFPVHIELNLKDWSDIKLAPWDFLIEVEKDAKLLMEKALNKNFKVIKASKGREYDLALIHPKGRELIIAISSHTAKTKSRSKEKTIQKILMDISKMLPHINDNTTPIVITKPIKFENSWSFTTNKYLDYYERKFGFKFLTTEFKKDWTDNIIEELLKI